MTHPRVTVIIVSWNARPLLEQCLPSVLATDWPALDVVLADNASTDDSVEWARKQYPAATPGTSAPRLHVVRHPENWAFARGNNEAVRADLTISFSSDYYVFLNNDVEVPPGWLRPLVERMEAEPRLGALQPKLLQYGDRTMFEYAGAAGGFLDRFGYPFTRGRMLFHMERDAGQYDDARTAFWATGAALMVRREAWEATGGFDETFVMHMEEIDLCWRMHREGWTVGVEPASEVYHIGGASLPKESPEKTFLNFRNNLLMLYKNVPPGRRPWLPGTFQYILAVRTLLDALAVGRAALSGRGAEAWAIVRAYAAAHRMKGAYRAARPTRETAVPLPYRRSILRDWFERRRRTFQELPDDAFGV
jgi:GT2 family glycosyltransferase